MKTITKQKIFRLDHYENTDSDTVEYIFADAVISYNSEVLLKQLFGIDNSVSAFNLKCWTCGVSHYQYRFSDQN